MAGTGLYNGPADGTRTWQHVHEAMIKVDKALLTDRGIHPGFHSFIHSSSSVQRSTFDVQCPPRFLLFKFDSEIRI